MSAAALGAALAMDAAAVSVSCGAGCKYKRLKVCTVTAAFFGFFQLIMPILGWSIGKVGSGVFGAVDHIIAFIILLILGAKMLFDARDKNDIYECDSLYGIKELFLLAVATSIDALASGIVIPVSVGADTPAEMAITVTMIGLITFALSFLGFFTGSAFSKLKPKYARIFGGLVLILIGMKTLISG